MDIKQPKLSRRERVAQNIQRLKETGSYCAKTSIAAKGDNASLQEINDRINKAKSTTEIFMDMKTLMTSVATAKGYIRKGQSKIRKGGTPDDFLNYCTMKMVERWKKQGDILTASLGQTKIDNWCAYGNIVMFSYLVEYNKSIFDMDVSPIPMQIDKDGEETEIEIEDTKSDFGYRDTFVGTLISKESIQTALDKLPTELSIYSLDILYFLQYHKYLDKQAKTFVDIGINFFRRNLENELRY